MAITTKASNDNEIRFDDVSSVLSRSWGLTPYADAQKDAHYAKRYPRKVTPISQQKALQSGDAFLLPTLSNLTSNNSVHWCDANGEHHHITVDKMVYDRLLRDCRTDHQSWLHHFIRNKWESLQTMRYPLIVSPDFYLLWKAICAVTHELFADLINASGVLSSFCSADTEDQRFGACGSWEDAEQLIDGGAGHPPFENDFLKKLLIRMEVNVRRNRPYCRVLILPFNENGVLRRLLDSDEVDFEGEVLAVIDRRLIRFRHQRELFKKHLVQQRPSGNSPPARDVSCAVANSKLCEEDNQESCSLQSAVDHDALDTD